jgi:dipeptidyl aminopeptidase/acylaminoacyl peptidase
MGKRAFGSSTPAHLLAILALALAAPLAAQQGRPFTAQDALGVRSASVEEVSPDGRWIAMTIRDGYDRLDVDHFRYGDATYVSPSTGEFVLLDAESGTQEPILEGGVQVRAATWSPDGTRLAFFLWDGERNELHIREEDGEVDDVDLDTPLEISSNSTLEWRPDGSGLLIQLREEGWAERARAAYLEMTEGPIVVHDGSEPFLDWDRVRNYGGLTRPAFVELDGDVDVLLPEGEWSGFTLSDDGRWLSVTGELPLKTVYEGNDGSEWRLLRVDLTSGDTTWLEEPSTDRVNANWSPEGNRYVYTDEGHVHLRDILADSARNLTEAFEGPVSATDTADVRFSVEEWRPDGGALLLESQRGWHLLDLGSGELDLVIAISEEEREEGTERSIVEWTEDGRFIYASTSERDRWERGLARLDVASGEWEQLVADANRYGGWELISGGQRILYRMSDGDRPDELYVADAELDGARRLTDLNPQLAEVALARSELVEYLDLDGEKRYGILYYPVGYQEGRRYPLVAEIYEDFFDNGFNANMNLLTSQGWFGFRPSVEFEEGFPGEAWMKAVTTGINTLIDRGLVDGERLGVHGTSYGGYAVNLLVTQTDRFAAAINISGKVNIISFLGDSEKITTRNYRAAESGQDRIGATLWEQPQKYIAHSAVMFADRIETPLLLLSGEGDWNVPATNQREMYYALRRLGKEVVWVNYLRAGHGAGRAGTEEDFHDHWSRILDWYRTHFDEAAAEAVVSDGSGG